MVWMMAYFNTLRTSLDFRFFIRTPCHRIRPPMCQASAYVALALPRAPSALPTWANLKVRCNVDFGDEM